MGAAEQLSVNARELEESKATKRKIPPSWVAVEQPEVSAGELVDSEARLLVSAEMAREEAGTW
jgi:hypothetical protein